jgi:ArsR family transcriptional regulator
MPIDPERFARIAKALADPRRFQILETIANCREVGCQRLCEQFPVAQPTMSHHLKELARAGLIEPWREGQFAFYRFRAEVLREYVAELEVRLGMEEVGALLRNTLRQDPGGETRIGSRRTPGS